jgi:heat shock protein HtpX
MLRRIVVFALAVLAVVAVAGLWLEALTLNRILAPNAYTPALLAVALLGVLGPIAFLLASKPLLVGLLGARVVAEPRTATEIWLRSCVRALAKQSGIATPEVGIYDSAEMNLCSAGASRHRAIVLVSAGLVSRMPREHAEALIAREVARISGGEMVTLELVQGVIDIFVILPARVIGGAIDRLMLLGRARRRRGPGFVLITLLALAAFGFLAAPVLVWFSRWQTYRADTAGAELAGHKRMLAALEHLKNDPEPHPLPDSVRTAFARGAVQASTLSRLAGVYPLLEDRIRALSGSLDAWPAAHEI